jgi:hypothetical protein
MTVFRILSVSLMFGLATSCSHYRMGSPNETTVPLSIWIEPIVLEESVSGVAIPLNRELREAVIRLSFSRLSKDSAHADRILKITITERQRESLARRSDDTGLSDVLSLKLTAKYVVSDANGLTLKNGEVSVEGQVFRSSGFGESSRQRLPSMLRNLADDILQDSLLNW